MKKLLFLFLLVFLFSCEKADLPKDEIPCYECITQQTKDIILTNIYCNKTADEIKDIERKGTFSHNLFGEWWHQTTVCTKQ